MALRFVLNASSPVVVGAVLEVAGDVAGVVMVRVSKCWETFVAALGTGVLMADTQLFRFARRSMHTPPRLARQ